MDVDVAIVGGGPAGLATALFLLAAAPRLRGRVAVFEKERFPRDKICGGAIGARADRLLGSIGVTVDVPSVPIRGLSVATRFGRLEARSDGAGAIGRVVRRIEFDHALAEQARARGVRIVEGAKASALEVDRSGVRLGTAQGEVRARAVVGADGVGSFVRRAIGVPRGSLRAQVVEADTRAAPEDRARDVLCFDLEDHGLHGYAWDFPTEVGGEPLVCRGVYQVHAAPAPGGAEDEAGVSSGGADVEARFAAYLARRGLPVEGLHFKRFAERGLSPHEPVSRPRVLLVGEAAGIDPVLGEGIAQAIQYGAVAGRYLARCLDEDRLSFTTWRRAIASSRVGVDLRLRAWALRAVYGPSRPAVERWLSSSTDIALAGMRWFAGDRVPRILLARAGVALARSFASRR